MMGAPELELLPFLEQDQGMRGLRDGQTKADSTLDSLVRRLMCTL